MVPYVRKSFYKHFTDGITYLEDDKSVVLKDKIENISINDEMYTSKEKAYKYAEDMTKKELMQAVEGMYHNLNSLQSRSGKSYIAALI